MEQVSQSSIDVSVIVPAMNEAENFPELLRRIDAALAGVQYEVLIVDDNSRDRTPEVCAELATKYPVKLLVRTKPTNGLSGAVLHGMAQARGNIFCVMDADLQHPPERLPALMEPLKNGEADFVIGSRYMPGGSTEAEWGIFRKLNSQVATLLARPFAGNTTDPMAGFFALRHETYKSARQLTPLGYKIALELMCKCRVKNAREIPIHFSTRLKGESKLSLKQQFRYLEHLSRLYDFKFPHASPVAKFLIATALGWFVSFAVYAMLLHSGAGHLKALALAYPSAILMTALLHLRYVSAQREFIVRPRPWMDFAIISGAEWATCIFTAWWVDRRVDRPGAVEAFILSVGAATLVRYVLRKEFMQDIRGLRKSLPREIEAIPRRADDPSMQQSNSSSGFRTVLLATLAFAICSIAAAVRSQGFLESDGGMHYLYARHAFSEPYYFVDTWGRPLCTALFAGPAAIGGLLGVRLTSLLLAIGCAWIAFEIAKGQEYKLPALAAIFTLGQPLLFLHSFSELTELPFAFVIGAALLAYQRRWWGAMAMFVALAPLGRPEGFGFLILAVIALMAHRKPQWLLVLPLGLVAWSIAGRSIDGPHDLPWWRWLIDHWPYEANSPYPSGNPLHFVARLPMLIGPFALPAMWLGMGLSLCLKRTDLIKDHRVRVQAFIGGLPLGVLIAHSLFFWFGKLSSSGELRYLLVVAPMWGLLTAKGWEWAFNRMNWKGATQWAALAVVTPSLVNFVYRVLPLEPETSWLEAQRVAAWYQRSGARGQYPRILCNHPGVYFYLDLSPTDPHRVVPWSKENALHPEKGVLLLWDPEYCVLNAGKDFIVTLPEAMRSGWVNDWRGEIESNVNNPPPWANYKVVHPPEEPADHSLPGTPILWHLFRSPLDAAGNTTPSIVRMDHSNSWREMPGSPFAGPAKDSR